MNAPDVVITEALEAVFATTNSYHRSARALRNRLVIMTVVAFGIALGLLVMQALIPRLEMVARPNAVKNIAPWQLLFTVMAFGAIGALLSSIRPISTLPPAFSPFNFPLQQTFLKIVVGTLTSAVGVIAVSATLTTKAFSVPALLFAAAAFGAGQQTVTRMLDDRATALVNASPSTPSA